MPTVTLVNTPTQRYSQPGISDLADYSTIPPLGLGYVATAASEVVGASNVSLLDAEHLRLSVAETAHRVISQRPTFVGINVTSPNYAVAREIITLVGTELGARVIIGGTHAILRADAILQEPSIRAFIYGVCTGDGEPTIQSLLSGTKRSHIPNFKYQNETGQLVASSCTKRLTSEELDRLRLDRRFFANDPLIDGLTTESYVLSSRGCPFRCAFCAAPRLCDELTRRSDESIRAELQTLIANGINYIRFVDDLLLTSTKRIAALRGIFNSLGLSQCNFGFEATARASITSKFRADTWQALAKIGLKELEIGIESGSPRILELMEKRTTRLEVSKTVREAVTHGIKVKGFFMVGYPTETKQDLDLTIQFARSLKEIAGDHIRFSPVIAKAYPGTGLYEKHERLVERFANDTLLVLSKWSKRANSEKAATLLDARTRYNSVHTRNGRPTVLSELTGGATLEEVVDALSILILISDEHSIDLNSHGRSLKHSHLLRDLS